MVLEINFCRVLSVVRSFSFQRVSNVVRMSHSAEFLEATLTIQNIFTSLNPTALLVRETRHEFQPNRGTGLT